jgi:hypothetical protein
MGIATLHPSYGLIGNRLQSIARPLCDYDAEAIRPGTTWLS